MLVVTRPMPGRRPSAITVYETEPPGTNSVLVTRRSVGGQDGVHVALAEPVLGADEEVLPGGLVRRRGVGVGDVLDPVEPDPDLERPEVASCRRRSPGTRSRASCRRRRRAPWRGCPALRCRRGRSRTAPGRCSGGPGRVRRAGCSSCCPRPRRRPRRGSRWSRHRASVHSCPANWNAGTLKLRISSSPIGSGVTSEVFEWDVAEQLAGRDVRDAWLGCGELDVGQLGMAVVEQRRSLRAREAQALVDLRAEVDDGVGELVVHGHDVALGGAPALDGLRRAALGQRDLALPRHEGHRQVQRIAVVGHRCARRRSAGYPAVRSTSMVIVIVADSTGFELEPARFHRDRAGVALGAGRELLLPPADVRRHARRRQRGRASPGRSPTAG